MSQKEEKIKMAIVTDFMNYSLNQDHYPKSVYKFCKETEIEEKVFYKFFGSINVVKNQVWEIFYDNSMSLLENVLIICGHYKGIDQRVRDHFVTHEISIGDYVLSGGELAAAVISDALIRLIPGVLNDETSALTDSFQDGLLAPPVYTRPAEFRGMAVPEILTSGHAQKIETWNHEQALKRTAERRPDLLGEE